MRVKFLPSSQNIDVQICDHRYDAAMTFSHETDARYLSSIYTAEMYGFKNNFKLGAFVNNITGPQNDGIPLAEATGLMRHDIYQVTEYWVNPVTGALQVIPDWASTTWTSAGAAVFNVTAGTPKAGRYPNHGQQMYDISGGDYGYDFSSGQSGDSNLSEYHGVIFHMQNWLRGQVGRSPSAGSYRLGITSMAQLQAPLWLGVRNSIPSPSVNNVNGNTFYGNSKQGGKLGIPTNLDFNRQTWNTYPSTSRWWDMWNTDGFTKSEATLYIQEQLALTLANGGWYRDFCHWHAAFNKGNISSIDEFLQVADTAFGGNFVHKCSNGEALEYMYLRELSHKVSAFDGNGEVMVFVDIYDQFKESETNGILNDVPLGMLNTPLTVKIDLSNTTLAGKNIKLNTGKPISLGNDVYLIEVPFVSKREGFMTLKISEDSSADYGTLDRPTGSTSVSGNTVTLTTDMPTKAVMFSGSDDSTVSRSNELSTSHEFDINGIGSYSIGFISEFGQANLIEV